MELIHRQLCERDIFKHQQESYQINSLENLASKQRIFRIFKEQHGSCKPCDQKITLLRLWGLGKAISTSHRR